MTVQRTRDSIIARALSLVGAKAADEDPSDSDVALAAEALDDLISLWVTSGAHLWSRNSATLFLQPSQMRYRIGDGSTENITEDYTITTLAAAVSTGAKLITIGSLSSPTNPAPGAPQVGDYVALKKSDGSLWWTTFKSVKPTYLLTDAVEEDFDSGTRVYYYTTRIGRALRVPDARRVINDTENLMVQYSRSDYLSLPNKATPGTPTTFYYDPKKTFGTLFIWPAPVATVDRLALTYYRPLNDTTGPDTDVDFPDSWILALKYNLGINIAPDLMGGLEPSPNVYALAERYYSDALDWDQGDTSLFVQPGRGMGRT